MKKIVYIVNTLMPTDKAHGYQISKTCEKFAGFGHYVELLVPDRKNHVADDLFEYYGVKRNFTVEKIPCPDVIFLERYIGPLAFYAQTLFFSMKLFVKKIERDSLIYSRDVLPVFIFKLRGFYVVYNAHTWSKKTKWFLKIFLGKDMKIVCNSEGTRKQILQDGFPNGIVVPNGVDVEEFDNLGGKLDLRKKLALPLDKKIAMYVGHLYGWKGVGVMIDSAKLLQHNSNVLFVVIGGDEEERSEYSAKIKNESIGNVLLLGHKFKKDIPQYITSADVLILPNIATTEESVNYTSPIKMFEYMASGVPILASDLPSLREVLNEGNSVLVKSGDPQALATGIEKILSDTELCERITRNANRDVKKYTWDAYAKKILDFIITA